MKLSENLRSSDGFRGGGDRSKLIHFNLLINKQNLDMLGFPPHAFQDVLLK